MPFNRICEICGVPFIAQGNRAKYCKPCAKKKQYEKIKARDQRRKEARETSPEVISIDFCDSPENIAVCLSCTKETCDLDKNKRCEMLTGNTRRNPKEHEFERICPSCGVHFVGKSGRATFCKSCREKRQKERAKIAKKKQRQKKV